MSSDFIQWILASFILIICAFHYHLSVFVVCVVTHHLYTFDQKICTAFLYIHSFIFLFNLQGLDGEATEPMIKELEEDREESQDPELEFAIAGAVREYGGLEILLGMIQVCNLS